MSEAKHTPGPWRWEYNEKHKSVHLVGGLRPLYDLTIFQPVRWGMNRAGLMIRDTAHDGMNIMHKLHERPDWIAPFEGRQHHADWCANVIHPDMRLIAAAPELLMALQSMEMALIGYLHQNELTKGALQKARAAIAEATGAPA